MWNGLFRTGLNKRQHGIFMIRRILLTVLRFTAFCKHFWYKFVLKVYKLLHSTQKTTASIPAVLWSTRPGIRECVTVLRSLLSALYISPSVLVLSCSSFSFIRPLPFFRSFFISLPPLHDLIVSGSDRLRLCGCLIGRWCDKGGIMGEAIIIKKLMWPKGRDSWMSKQLPPSHTHTHTTEKRESLRVMHIPKVSHMTSTSILNLS